MPVYCPKCAKECKNVQALKFHYLKHQKQKANTLTKADFIKPPKLKEEIPVVEIIKPKESPTMTNQQKPPEDDFQCECGAEIRKFQKFCSACGQELDW